MIKQWVLEFARDAKVQWALLLVLADFILGVTAALKEGTFRFAYVADFLRQDILGKVVPYFVFYVLALVAGSLDALPVVPIDFGDLAGTAYVVLVAAFVGSILSSAKHLGVNLPRAFAGEKPPPGP